MELDFFERAPPESLPRTLYEGKRTLICTDMPSVRSSLAPCLRQTERGRL